MRLHKFINVVLNVVTYLNENIRDLMIEMVMYMEQHEILGIQLTWSLESKLIWGTSSLLIGHVCSMIIKEFMVSWVLTICLLDNMLCEWTMQEKLDFPTIIQAQ